MILTLPPAYTRRFLGVEFDLAVARIRLSAFDQPFFRTLSARLLRTIATNAIATIAAVATSLDKT